MTANNSSNTVQDSSSNETQTVPCRYTGTDVETRIGDGGKGITETALLAALDSRGVLDDL